MEAPRLILFDIGSTLWDSPPEDPGALAHCYGRAQELLRSTSPGVPPIEVLIEAVEGYFAEWEDRWKADSSIVKQGPTSEFVAQALSKLQLAPPPDVLQQFTDLILETSVYTAKVLQPEEGMPEALAALREQGVRLACVSNAFMTAAGLQAIMLERGLGQHLDFTVSSCEFGYRKPHASIYQEALRLGGVTGPQTIFVGDRLDADVAGPAGLGMRTVLTHQYRVEDPAGAKVAPDLVITHLRELAPWVDKLLADT